MLCKVNCPLWVIGWRMETPTRTISARVTFQFTYHLIGPRASLQWLDLPPSCMLLTELFVVCTARVMPRPCLPAAQPAPALRMTVDLFCAGSTATIERV